MAATIIEIADAVAAALNAAELSEGLLAERAYVPVHGLDELARLRVTVVPSELSATPISRRDDDFDYGVDVGIQRKTDGSLDDLDSLMRLAEEIVDVFRGKRLAGYEQARCVEVVNAPVFDPGHLDERKVFTSVVRLTFRVARGVTP